ncbi:uncharacterized protein At4g00950-like [Impatiens glandulifera]|uniref:uncharacterized protein At4g00950-like n=1 Tax=Impatiens glandulifera TaxID=253017 RepID=UPI001FB0E2F2|nr:uncharacterized protein At4g00950-like [Impatiens glandulifera]
MAPNKDLQSTTPISTPKLALSSLPIKPSFDTPGSITPPFGTSISIPFQWEEIPGKPRTGISNSGQNPVRDFHKPSVVRCLELPPRLMIINESAKMTGLPSPTTVLEGPDHDLGSNSSFCTNSNSMSGRLVRKDKKWKLGSSWRWGSFREVNGLSDDISSCSRIVDDESKTTNVKLRRRKSFVDNFVNMRERLKQAMPWRHKQH